MESILLALTIVSSSFFGSWHCAAMCGPVASLMGQRKSLFSYHLGRLVSYTLLGAAAGYLGQFFLNSEFITLRWTAVILLSLILILSGIHNLLPLSIQNKLQSYQFSHFILNAIRRFQAFHLNKSGFAVGLLTALLPCGWLYTYVTAAIATKSPWGGAALMFLFWLGGLPALIAVPMMVRSSIARAGLRQQKIAGAILVFAGIYSLLSFFFLTGH